MQAPLDMPLAIGRRLASGKQQVLGMPELPGRRQASDMPGQLGTRP
ncbi:hypothetical protein SLH49_19645 [Cognatiyoonia sp. IB215446]|nr:hypothetical protein [Cognatiyoonia sp. IB215446]MDX8350211.1 hypothetical protein [Cognatiyoonia sp. IB215446]